MTGIFVTATGTEVGKTFISTALIRYANRKETAFLATKPIISGWPNSSNGIKDTDTALLIKAQDLPLNEENIAAVSPWRFTLALTPDMAAKAQDDPIDVSKLLDFCKRQEAQAVHQKKIHLIEGVGGLMSPIKGRFTNLEWVKSLQYPCILVVGTYLGALSHTLTALKVLQSEGVGVVALVVNETLNSPVSLAQTVEYLKDHVFCDVIEMPWQPRDPVDAYIAALYQSLLKRGK